MPEDGDASRRSRSINALPPGRRSLRIAKRFFAAGVRRIGNKRSSLRGTYASPPQSAPHASPATRIAEIKYERGTRCISDLLSAQVMNGTRKRWQFIPQAARLGSRAACALLEGSRAHASFSSHVGRCLVGMCEVGGGPSLETASLVRQP
jgi:hypothetical protein